MRKLMVASVFAMAVVGLAGNAFATDSRIETLGNQWFIEDDTNIFFNPANLVQYPDSVYINFTQANGNATNGCLGDGFGDGTVTGDLDVAGFGPGGNCSDDVETYGGGHFKVTDDIVAAIYVARHGTAKYHGELNDGFAQVLSVGFTSGPLLSGSTVPTGNFNPGILNDTPGITGTSGTTPFENPIDVIVAGNVTDDIALGLHFFFARGENRDSCSTDELNSGNCGAGPVFGGAGVADGDLDSTEQNITSYLWSVDVGARAELESITPELWIDFSQLKFHNDVSASFTDSADPEDASLEQELDAWRLGVGARAWYDINDNFTLLPFAEYTYVKGETQRSVNEDDSFDVFGVCGGVCTDVAVEDFEDDSVDAKYNAFMFGVALQYHADKILVTGSARGTWARLKAEINNPRLEDNNGVLVHEEATENLEETVITLPTVALGVEYAWKPMVTFRGGIETTTIFTSDSVEADADGDTSNDPDPEQIEQAKDSFQTTSADMGLGLHFGNLTLDGTVGGLVIGGSSNYFSRVSFVYNFR